MTSSRKTNRSARYGISSDNDSTTVNRAIPALLRSARSDTVLITTRQAVHQCEVAQ